MLIDDILANLASQNITSVWLFQTNDRYGTGMFVLLDSNGAELAWRWLSDSPTGWRTEESLLDEFSEPPADAIEFDFTCGLDHVLTIFDIEDMANGTPPPPRPPWLS
ncbi:hypothetical protein [Klebsiella pneumoniae]|uniref:hypothetical protein n=1 Tax=Klebsiella pneumoniae TaxID=573 RepID=UPI001037DA47|nr:hypothetical protein [Klebsiella pneumoniae]QBI37378.1 hypothetical protein WN11_26555 [Klebsiella pneumoniae]HBS5970804.1 hypothetical protein [Klebsiella pneumoniae]